MTKEKKLASEGKISNVSRKEAGKKSKKENDTKRL